MCEVWGERRRRQLSRGVGILTIYVMLSCAVRACEFYLILGCMLAMMLSLSLYLWVV